MSGSAFKEQATEDLSAVFFSDREEFWESHVINGKAVPVQIDNDELIQRSASKVINAQDAALYKGKWLIYVRAEDFGAKPAVGSLITFDDRKRRIVDVDEQMGLYIIELEALRS